MNVEKIIREYITKTIHMSLATTHNNLPWVCEVHFAYDDDLNLYFRSKESRRHSQEIATNSHVAGSIVAQHERGEYPHAIYFEGTVKLINDESNYEEIYQYFKKCQDADVTIIDEARKDDGHKFYKILVENWYAFGKFGGDSGQKLKLEWNGGAS